MAKKESTIINMVLTLFMVTAVAATALGYVYEFTKEPIAAAKKEKLEKAIGVVVPEFDEVADREVKAVDSDVMLTFYEAKKGGEVVGTAVKSYSDKGFTTRIWIIVGFRPDGSIHNYQILDHKETPGLGDKMAFWFNDEAKVGQCILNKNPGDINLTVSKDGGDIDAITAATITSRAFLDAVQRAYDTYKSNK